MTNKFIELAAPGVQQLKPYIPGKPVETLERELGVTNSLKLASNENPLGPSPLAVEAAQSVVASVNFYPDGSGYKLVEALSSLHRVRADSITLGNGSNDVLELIARAFLTPQHSAVFSQYAFAVYPIVTQAIGATAKVAPALAVDHPEMPYGHDLEAMLSLIDATTRIVFIANPNNPTGTWLKPDALKTFLGKVPDSVIVVLDEAYYEYMPDDCRPDTESLLRFHENLIVTRTFSKMYGLAGLRIGYAISDSGIADLLNRVRQPFNTNLLAQAAALAALSDHNHIQRSFDSNRLGLQQLQQGFDELGLSYIPSIGNFLTVDFQRDAAPIDQALLQLGVITRPLAGYQMPHHLRVTVGTESHNQRLLSALTQVLEQQGSGRS